MVMLTSGAVLLREFIEDNKLSQKQAADALGVKPPTIHEWITGAKRPRAEHREAISIWTHGSVPVANWLLEEERAAIAGAVPFEPEAPTGT